MNPIGSPFAFRSFRSRLLVLFLTLIGSIGLLTLSVLQEAHENSARLQISEQIAVAADVLGRFVASHSELLKQSTYPLGRDYAFQKAFSTNDRPTVRSAMESLRKRVRGDLLVLAGTDEGYPVIVDSMDSPLADKPFPLPDLIVAAEDSNEPVSAFAPLFDRVYSLAVVPILAPEPIAWLCIGYKADDPYVTALGKVVRCDVSIVRWPPASAPRLLASTLPLPVRPGLEAALRSQQPATSPGLLSLAGERVVFSVCDLEGRADLRLVVQRSLEKALVPFRLLQRLLWLIGAAGMLLAMIGIFVVSRQVSLPLKALAAQAQHIRDGEYGVLVRVDQVDEIGDLASAFNQMTLGLADKERISDLLGKVVSPAIAQELLRNKEIQLGGEEREATILFSDIRNFTPLCEGRSPTQVLEMLNFYLTRMTEVIDSHGGVVDKFIGDAIMAIFGAPIRHDDDPDRALLAALDMVRELEQVKKELREKGIPDFDIGIGINTDVVMAGNMGSRNRHNYTVIGDGVNLASRLESSSKELKQVIIVSEATLKKARGRYHTKPLGEVKVKGKSEMIRAFALLGKADAGEAASPG